MCRFVRLAVACSEVWRSQVLPHACVLEVLDCPDQLLPPGGVSDLEVDLVEQVFNELGPVGRERLQNSPDGELSYGQVGKVWQVSSRSRTVRLLCDAINARAKEGHVHHGGNLRHLSFACCRPTLATPPVNTRPAAIRSPSRNSAPTTSAFSARSLSPLPANAAASSTRLLSPLPAQRLPEKPSAEEVMPTEYGKQASKMTRW